MLVFMQVYALSGCLWDDLHEGFLFEHGLTELFSKSKHLCK